MPYTLDTLRAINVSYTSEHFLSQSDLEKVNQLSALLEKWRQGDPVPTDGDVVICVADSGEVVCQRGHLEKCEGWPLSVYMHPSTPFVYKELKMSSVSGGPQILLDEHELEYVGKQLKTFCTWGHGGPCGHGAIDFQVEVSVWKIVSDRSRFC